MNPDLQMSDLAFADDAERLLLVDDLPEEDAKDGACKDQGCDDGKLTEPTTTINN